MVNKSAYFFSITQCMVFIISLFYSEYYGTLSLVLTFSIIFCILNKLGNGIVLRELIALHGCVFCLIMPWIGYQWYTSSNALSSLWVSYMPVPDNIYFPFALPAMAGFITAICWPFNKKNVSDEGDYISSYLQRAAKHLKLNPHIGLVLIIAGIFFLYAGPFLPDSLQYPANLIYTSAYAGLLYIYFNKSLPYRRIAIALFVVFICAKALGGMFTEIAYMGITLFSFLFIGKKTSLLKKTFVFFVSVFFLIVLQSVKLSYRKEIWGKGNDENKAILFSNIMTEKVQHVSSLFDSKTFFPIYARFNQGFNVGLVLRQFPKFKPYDNGGQLFYNAASSFVPRFLWPDKPQSGGKFNMQYYAGYKIRNWSTNVGPLGEAYGSFGVSGGISFMFFLGLMIRWFYRKVFLFSKQIPLLLFWIPLLFYQVTYSLEADTLQIMNSLIKSTLFLFILYKSYSPLFGVVKRVKEKLKFAY